MDSNAQIYHLLKWSGQNSTKSNRSKRNIKSKTISQKFIVRLSTFRSKFTSKIINPIAHTRKQVLKIKINKITLLLGLPHHKPSSQGNLWIYQTPFFPDWHHLLQDYPKISGGNQEKIFYLEKIIKFKKRHVYNKIILHIPAAWGWSSVPPSTAMRSAVG